MMNHQITSATITDFRFLDVTHPIHRVQIEHGLTDMGVNQDVIFWFFTQVDDLKAEYTEELKAPNTKSNYYEAKDPQII